VTILLSSGCQIVVDIPHFIQPILIRGEHKIRTHPSTDISESPTGPSGGLKRVSDEEMLKNKVCVGLDGRARFLQIQNHVNRTRPSYKIIYTTKPNPLYISPSNIYNSSSLLVKFFITWYFNDCYDTLIYGLFIF